MTRWLRFLLTALAARRRPGLDVASESRLALRVWPTECDAAFLNHAALLSIMECGRIDIMVRFGFLKLARRQGWYLPLASVAVRFDRPLRRFDRLELASRIVAWDDAAIWIEHRVTRGGVLTATGLAKTQVRHGREDVALARILGLLGMEVPPAPATPLAVERLEAALAALAR
jgi:acyl-CoA thioesterase FadM